MNKILNTLGISFINHKSAIIMGVNICGGTRVSAVVYVEIYAPKTWYLFRLFPKARDQLHAFTFECVVNVY